MRNSTGQKSTQKPVRDLGDVGDKSYYACHLGQELSITYPWVVFEIETYNFNKIEDGKPVGQFVI